MEKYSRYFGHVLATVVATKQLSSKGSLMCVNKWEGISYIRLLKFGYRFRKLVEFVSLHFPLFQKY